MSSSALACGGFAALSLFTLLLPASGCAGAAACSAPRLLSLLASSSGSLPNIFENKPIAF
jgi:hypothetical protein